MFHFKMSMNLLLKRIERADDYEVNEIIRTLIAWQKIACKTDQPDLSSRAESRDLCNFVCADPSTPRSLRSG